MRLNRRALLATPPLAAATTFGSALAGPSPSAVAATTGEHWPGVAYDPSFAALVKGGVADYPPGDHLRFLDDYTPTGSYFKYGHVTWSSKSTAYTFDEQGIPRTIYNGTAYDQPVTIGHYALHLFDRITRFGETDKTDLFFRCVERLLSIQRSDGMMPYPFDYKVYNYQFTAPWPSAMAQGTLLSVLRRALTLRNDARFVQAGNKSVVFLTRTVERGGVQQTLAALDPSLVGYVWLEEFPTTPPNFKLNGFLFTLFGLYDWWQRAPQITDPANKVYVAGQLFQSGVKTAALTLPYFDLRGYTTPDMRHTFTPGLVPRIQPGYHRVHIYQLNALKQITSGDLSERFAFFEKLWRYYVGDTTI